MSIPFSIAFRYLLGKKSHSAVNAIAIVSVAGVAVATAAVICVLSVFNGFRSVIADRLDTLSPDLLVVPKEGKTISDGDSLASAISAVSGVDTAMPSLTDNALAYYDGREMPITLKGVVPEKYSKVTSIDSLIVGGDRQLVFASDAPALLSVGVAYKLQKYDFDSPVTIFAPKRLGRYNPANPAAAFVMDSLDVQGIFQSMQQTYDENTVITGIDIVRDLLLYDREATSVEIKVKDPEAVDRVLEDVQKVVGDRYVVKDRLMQQEVNFRMVQIEKWVTFLLLFFILVIASFNIISTLSMLVLEKQDSMHTLAALGMRRDQVAAVFRWESVLVSAFGSAAGILLGVALCMVQQIWGVIKVNVNSAAMETMAYPVALEPMDILVTLVPVTMITLVCAFVAGSFARSRMK